ncbi:MAG: acyl-CoA dehydrogenase [Desulfobacterium sp. 4572_20]|nr:acyl-CoA dehydrogenase family protein [Deltaproteobacteria bacterium]MBW2104608.1 acyl-CoA dehydrogenase family protein [Deltaproteobacteria bacterium]MCD6266630.1 acyl-CoA dehydrogenase family protein [Deltaproteobacteria bacterium]OQY16259.1 MAG: acyl-CoA dehydrogenase [Desulfobacterium sp. 4572_20]HDH88031.1 acyl-CoA dehydrogenase [Desulfobacteraceae bacterium]
MEFTLDKEQEAIQKAAREFAKGEFDKEIALEHERNHTFPSEIWKKACELGFMGIHYPEKYGGQEYGIFENVLVVEEFCRQDSGIGVAISLADFSSEIILRFGNEQQKEKYLIPLTKGEAISSGGFTEPDHGSDITLMDTTAKKEGDEYIINGVKTFITNGTISDFVMVLCQTDFEAKPTYRGQSVIIVEKETPGYSRADVGEKMGIKMTSTGELSFNDVRVPVSNLVGQENKGFYHVLEFFDESRIEIAGQALGIAQGAFDRALAYCKERTQFGKKLAQFQVTQHKLADMAAKIELASLIVHKSAWNFDQGRIDPKLTSIAKMYAARTAVEVADEAIQLLGGYGYMLEYEVERFYRDAKITEIYEGTKEIQKNTIASSLLGKF